jgi:hypothetical protein
MVPINNLNSSLKGPEGSKKLQGVVFGISQNLNIRGSPEVG